jgi:NAD(P)-dependent dehydrogenase (short-subunit alcohol dehydrogenase family)
MSDLPSKVIAVTGGASGIGLATVKTLCKSKSIVIVGDLAPDASPGLQEVISATDLVTYRQLDVSSRESAHAFVVGIVKEHGRLDGLVNNAGICPNEGEMASDEVFDKIMAVNLKGVWHMGTEAILQMNRQETKGVIVNTASDGALKGIPGIPAYVASKHAVLGLTRTWCKEWTPKGIRVNAVAPGM